MSTDGPATLDVGGELRDALGPAVLAGIAPAALARWLGAQRWYGAKAEPPQSARLHDVTPLFDGDAVLARIAVTPREGAERLYQVPLTIAANGADAATLAAVRAGKRRGAIVDAVHDPVFRQKLGFALAAGSAYASETLRWTAAPIGGAEVHLGTESRVLGGEQSNTSIVYGDDAILKLYRRLEPGENPDAEILEFLTAHARFPHVPALLGTIVLHDRDGSQAVGGLLQRFVAASGDGWTHALAELSRDLARPGDAVVGFAADAQRIGRVTRALHEALAADHGLPAFTPEPVSPADLRAWVEAAGRSIRAGLDLLEMRWKEASADLAPLARGLLSRRGEATAVAGDAAAAVAGDAGLKIRHHGDYHLGQLLRTADGEYLVTDFEGEPARPLEERRERRSALRDVAGMLRSFAYAATAAADGLVGEPAADAATPARRERAAAWERAVRAAFLDGYFAGEQLPAFLPSQRDDAQRLIALFEIEKGFYELAYELNNRPSWVSIPVRGLLRLLDEAE